MIKNIKIVVFFLLVSVMTSYSQKAEWAYGINGMGVFPLGDYENAAKTGFGAGLSLITALGESTGFVFNAEYLRQPLKTADSDYAGGWTVKGGFRYYIGRKKDFYIFTSAGIQYCWSTVKVNDNMTIQNAAALKESLNKGVYFIGEPGFGISIDLSRKVKIEVETSYRYVQSAQTAAVKLGFIRVL